MKIEIPFLLSCFAITLVGCNHNQDKQRGEVISERYIHKYGYDITKDEFESTGYPGSVVTTLRNGVTISSTYEDGKLHGPTSYTYPHSNTLESVNIYEEGRLIKKLSYTIRGIPKMEEIYLSPTRTKVTKWFAKGTPMSIEEREDGALLEGEYFNERNETLGRVIHGQGERLEWNDREKIELKETIENGNVVKREVFFENGNPYTITHWEEGQLHGGKQVFASSGEPVAFETWRYDILHGPATYFQNGYKYLEVNFRNGKKHGVEKQYIDGESIVQETHWLNGEKHGPSTGYYDGLSKVQWFYNNELVSKEKYRELSEREAEISMMNERAKPKERI